LKYAFTWFIILVGEFVLGGCSAVLGTLWLGCSHFLFFIFRSLYLSVILSNFDTNLQPKVENEIKGNAALRRPLYLRYNEFIPV
jgi:hypothetical protein